MDGIGLESCSVVGSGISCVLNLWVLPPDNYLALSCKNMLCMNTRLLPQEETI